MKPDVGMSVMFGHLLLSHEGPDGLKRRGVIVAFSVLGYCTVRVQFLEEDARQFANVAAQPDRLVNIGGCKFYESEDKVPELLPASHWQYCYPLGQQ